MAPRKKPAMILKRDHAFTEVIGRPANRKPNAFSMASEEFQEKLETARTTETGEALEGRIDRAGQPDPVDAIAHPEAPDDTDRQGKAAVGTDAGPPFMPELPDAHSTKVQAATDAGNGEAPDQQTEAHPKGRKAEPQPKAAGAGGVETVEVIVSIMVPKDLVERAGRWAAIARQPAPTVLRHALKKMKPQLRDELKTIRVGDVHQDRIEEAGYRLQSRLRFTPTEFADMQARLDPAGFGILSSMLNHYSRDSFTDFLDKLLTDNGY